MILHTPVCDFWFMGAGKMMGFLAALYGAPTDRINHCSGRIPCLSRFWVLGKREYGEH